MPTAPTSAAAAAAAAYRDHLVDAITLHVNALFKLSFIDARHHEALLMALTNAVSAAPPVTSAPSVVAPPAPPTSTKPLTNAPSGIGPRISAVPNPLMALPTSQQHQPAPPTSASPAAVRKSTMPNPIRIAIKDFRTGVDGDLAFSVGDMIEVIAEVDENWMSGTLNGRTGIFPTNFTEPRVAKPIIPSMSPKPPPAIAASVTPSASMLPPQPPALSSKPSGKLSAANTSRTPHTPLPLHQQATASIISTASSIPQPQPPTTTATDLQFFYLRSKANGNVLGVEMGLTSMVTHDSPVLVVPLTAKNTEPLMLRRDESGCLITPSNLALDVRFGEWVNGGTVVLAKRVPPANVPEGAFHQRWEITGDGSVRSVDRNFQLVEDYGRAIIWESDVDLEDQRWDMVPLM